LEFFEQPKFVLA